MIHSLLSQLPNLVDEPVVVVEINEDVSPKAPISDTHRRLNEEPAPEYSRHDPSASTPKSSDTHSPRSMRFAHPDDTLIDADSLADDEATFIADFPFARHNVNAQDTREHSRSRSRERLLSSSSDDPMILEPTIQSKDTIQLSSLLQTADLLHEKFPPLQANSKSPSPSSSTTSRSQSPSTSHPLTSSASPSDMSISDDKPSMTESTPNQSTPNPSADTNTTASVRIDDIFGPTSVLFTWSEDSENMLSDDAAEALVAEGLEGVCEIYDGSSDRDLNEGTKEEDDDYMRKRIAEERRKDERRKELIRGGVGLSVALVVGFSAIILYSIDQTMSGEGRRDARSLSEWWQSSTWAAGLVIGLGERVLGPFN